MNDTKTEPAVSHSALSVPAQRHDGWTVERQEAFLKALAACGCVRDACKAVGMSHVSAYALRARPSAIGFRAAWDAALDCAMSRLEDAALARAIHGVARPVFFKGEQIGEWRDHDERLAMFLLRYRRPHRFGAQLDRPAPACSPDVDGPDEDEAMGRLDWHLEELTDDGAPPAVANSPRALDGVNFGNFADGVESDSETGGDDAPE